MGNRSDTLPPAAVTPVSEPCRVSMVECDTLSYSYTASRNTFVFGHFNIGHWLASNSHGSHLDTKKIIDESFDPEAVVEEQRERVTPHVLMLAS